VVREIQLILAVRSKQPLTPEEDQIQPILIEEVTIYPTEMHLLRLHKVGATRLKTAQPLLLPIELAFQVRLLAFQDPISQ
jgi:hypothetical protein